MDIRAATLKSFDAGGWTADLQVDGSLSVWLREVPVSRGIPAAEMTAGRRCAVVVFDDANPQDAVVAAVFT